jgi:hypothetical protein
MRVLKLFTLIALPGNRFWNKSTKSKEKVLLYTILMLEHADIVPIPRSYPGRNPSRKLQMATRTLDAGLIPFCRLSYLGIVVVMLGRSNALGINHVTIILWHLNACIRHDIGRSG